MQTIFRRVICGAAIAGMLGTSVAMAAGKSIRLTVDAGKHDRVNTPVTVLLEVPAEAKSVAVVDAAGKEIAAQLTQPGLLNESAEGKRELHFVLPNLSQGESTTLTATFSEEPAKPAFVWEKVPGEYAELSLGDKPVLRYMCQTLTDETREDAFKVYHHVYNPAGTRLVTKGPGSLYTHHRGLFFGYCNVGYEGGKANTWSGRNTPETPGGYLAEEAGPLLGRHQVAVDWRGSNDDVYLKERRELTVYDVPGGRLIEFASRLATTGGKVTLDGNAPHAGFQFRAAAEVAEKTGNLTYYLRPDGKGPMGQARAKAFDLPWDAISFVLADDDRYTVVYLDRPDNPKPAEYNERTYGRFGSFFRYELEPGGDLAVRYRIWLQDGEMTVEEATALSNDFVDPVRVSIQ